MPAGITGHTLSSGAEGEGFALTTASTVGTKRYSGPCSISATISAYIRAGTTATSASSGDHYIPPNVVVERVVNGYLVAAATSGTGSIFINPLYPKSTW